MNLKTVFLSMMLLVMMPAALCAQSTSKAPPAPTSAPSPTVSHTSQAPAPTLAPAPAILHAPSSSSPSSSPTPAPLYSPSPDQAKDLKIATLNARLAQSLYQQKVQAMPEFVMFQSSVTDMQRVCVNVIKANKWPDDVVCDYQQDPVKFCRGALPCPAGNGDGKVDGNTGK
jgi:hypothetical protein